MTPTIKSLVTATIAKSYLESESQWVFVKTLLEDAGIPATIETIDELEDALECAIAIGI